MIIPRGLISYPGSTLALALVLTPGTIRTAVVSRSAQEVRPA
jgi:hypothetical protein